MAWDRTAGGQAGLILVLLAPQLAAQSESEKLGVGATNGTRMQYLTERYDQDGDGVISASEYDRGADRFARLDSNQDGKISADDFESRGRGMRMDPASLAALMVRRSFSAGEGEEEGLSLDAFNERLAKADSDGDALLTRKEFEEHAGEQDSGGGLDAYATLLEVIDEDGDQQLSLDEFVAWFDNRDLNEDLFLDSDELPSLGPRRGRGSSRREPAVNSNARNAVGKVAPDFDLRPPKGGESVRLSSFAGDRPVALIFGSYT